MTPEEKAKLLMEAFQSPGMRQQLAAAMAAPIRRQLNMQSVARRLFPIDPLPEPAVEPVHDPEPVTDDSWRGFPLGEHHED